MGDRPTFRAFTYGKKYGPVWPKGIAQAMHEADIYDRHILLEWALEHYPDFYQQFHNVNGGMTGETMLKRTWSAYRKWSKKFSLCGDEV